MTEVLFNGVASSFTVDSDTQITADVPAGASAGIISVSTAAGTDQKRGHVRGVLSNPRLNLRLGRSLFASGTVRVTDGFGMCRRRVTVAIQRHVSGGWRLVAHGVTDAQGAFKVSTVD